MQFPKNSWSEVLKETLTSSKTKALFEYIDTLYNQIQVVPTKDKVFKAFELTPFNEVKVVILGQDPYPNAQDAMGLAFSIPNTQKLPKSLVNIFKELQNDLKQPLRTTGDLTDWATQGVLLLNTALTNIAGERDAHKKIGWNETFSTPVIKALNARNQPTVFILWGKSAQVYANYITSPQHLVLSAPHPSPLGAYRGFWDSKPFSKTNDFLIKTGQQPIKWS